MKLTIRPMKLSCPVSLICFALASTSFALDPPPGGGYPNEVTALGDGALSNDTPGADNTGIGFQALYSDTSAGFFNTAVGSLALRSNTTGYQNVAVGFQPLYGNTTGYFNIAIGGNALIANTTGVLNVAVGNEALQAHPNGGANVAVGPGAMSLGTKGDYNTAVGSTAMAFSNGSDNVAVGDGAMNVANGSSNVAIGHGAGLNFAGNNNIAIGLFAGQNVTTGKNNIQIGNQGQAADTGMIRLGTEGSQKTTFVAGIRNTPLASGVAVAITADGQMGVRASSARYKEAIKPMDKASEAILALKPVSFRYKKEIDPKGQPQFGLVAEEVAKVDPDLVVTDAQGKPFTVRYDEVNAMLLNEFLKEHRKVEQLQATVAQQQSTNSEEQKQIAALTTALKRQAAQIEKVSAQVAAKKAAPRVVAND